MEDSLGVGNLIGRVIDFIADLLRPILEPLHLIGWDLGDWTLFTAILLPLGWWAILRIRGQSTRGRRYFILLIVGFLLGGVIEHYQPKAESWLGEKQT